MGCPKLHLHFNPFLAVHVLQTDPVLSQLCKGWQLVIWIPCSELGWQDLWNDISGFALYLQSRFEVWFTHEKLPICIEHWYFLWEPPKEKSVSFACQEKQTDYLIMLKISTDRRLNTLQGVKSSRSKTGALGSNTKSVHAKMSLVQQHQEIIIAILDCFPILIVVSQKVVWEKNAQIANSTYKI